MIVFAWTPPPVTQESWCWERPSQVTRVSLDGRARVTWGGGRGVGEPQAEWRPRGAELGHLQGLPSPGLCVIQQPLCSEQFCFTGNGEGGTGPSSSRTFVTLTVPRWHSSVSSVPFPQISILSRYVLFPPRTPRDIPS